MSPDSRPEIPRSGWVREPWSVAAGHTSSDGFRLQDPKSDPPWILRDINSSSSGGEPGIVGARQRPRRRWLPLPRCTDGRRGSALLDGHRCARHAAPSLRYS